MMEEKRIGVYVCWCGTNIAKMVDVEDVAREVESLPGVIISRNYKYMCSDPGQELIIYDIKEHNLNRVVVAACSPRIHELTFRKALENAGLNPYMFEMANIREQVSWVHMDKKAATKKAKSLVAGAISKVQWHESLEKKSVEINPATLILGGGISGLTAALEIADANQQVYLIEKQEKLGGYVAHLDLTFPYLYSADQMIRFKIKRVLEHPNIHVFLNSQISEIHGYVGNFETSLNGNGETKQLSFGNIILATGLKTFNPSIIPNYKYGIFPNIVTSLEFEKMLRSGRVVLEDGSEPKRIAIIHCVGSRNRKYHSFCSRTCCMTALKYANQLAKLYPESYIFDIYADMRAFGKGCEELYAMTARKNVFFMMFDQVNGMPWISKSHEDETHQLIIELHERLSDEDIEVPVDLVILMVAKEAHEDAKSIARAAHVSMCGDQFYIEKHPKLDPVATTTNGVYIVGTCQGPKDIPDSVSQARAAAARILATINHGQVEVQVTTAEVNAAICCGCQTCISVCPYNAIQFKEEEDVSYVNSILCKGCGTCGSTCPTGAIKAIHFTDQQILSQIDGLMSKALELQEN
jgi:heterodisulfide reductase subunit A